jgi:hypothetical protein
MKRSYWKEHPIDVILTIAGILFGIYTSSQVAAALSDLSVRHNLLHCELPKGTTIVPFNRQHYPEQIIPTEPISLFNWLGLSSPFIVFGLTAGVESIRYCKWKKSIQK